MKTREPDRQECFDVLVFSMMSEGVMIVDPEYRITLANAAALEMFGTEQLVGKDARSAVLLSQGIDRIPRENQALMRAFSEKKPVTTRMNEDFFFQKPDGKRIPIVVMAAPLITDGEIRDVIVVFRDVTAEKEIGAVQSSFIATASHQLRTPLTGMRWFSEMLLAGDVGEMTDMQKHFVRRVYEGTERMITLVGLLLKLAWAESGKINIVPEPCDMKTLIEECLSFYDSTALSSLDRVTLRFDPEPFPPVAVDAEMFKQVLRNLLSNAFAYSLDDEPVEVAVVRTAERIEVSVKYSGFGIFKHEQSRVFERFFRSESALNHSPNGWGLNLALAKDIVEAWGGTIWFTSEEGKGTTFFFTMPLTGMVKREAWTALVTGA